MALDRERWNQRRFYSVLFCAFFAHDGIGWEFVLKTPLFGFLIARQWISIYSTTNARMNLKWFGLLTRWTIEGGGIMYRWNWDNKEAVVAQGNSQQVPDPNQISPKFFDQVAQIAHFFALYALNFTFVAFFGFKWLWLAFVLSLLYAVIHEFVYDPLEENAATRGSDMRDFIFLMLGAATGEIFAILLVALRGHV